MAYGQGDYVYELDEGWGRLPEGLKMHLVSGVSVDADDQVYVFNRGDHQMLVFDRDGAFLRSWDQTFTKPHGLHVGPDGNIYLSDLDSHVVMKYSPDGGCCSRWGRRTDRRIPATPRKSRWSNGPPDPSTCRRGSR